MSKPVTQTMAYDRGATNNRLDPALAFTPQDDRLPPVIETTDHGSPSTTAETGRSAAPSVDESYMTDDTSTMPGLQGTDGGSDDILEPLSEEDLDPGSFDLVAPLEKSSGIYSLEERSELLFSEKHLAEILADSSLLYRFSEFLRSIRPASVPLLNYYLDAEKALRALQYANAVAGSLAHLSGHDFSSGSSGIATNASLRSKRDAAFAALARDELPMYITHAWLDIVSLSIKRRITGTMSSHLRQMSEGLAEVFCLTDPSRHDNPIIMASEEFHRTTQYGMNHVLGRNCRFLQGPGTNPFSVRRIRDKLDAGQTHFETFLNYRRDGSPFLNLLLCAPLLDSRGKVRYFLGAQVDVSGLGKDCVGLEGLKRLVRKEEAAQRQTRPTSSTYHNGDHDPSQPRSDAQSPDQSLQELSQILNPQEVEHVRRIGGTMHRTYAQELASYSDQDASGNWPKTRVVIQDESPVQTPTEPQGESLPSMQREVAESGGLSGVYENYILVRPTSDYRILFASPGMRFPGMLQSPFLSRVGGSGRNREKLRQAFDAGQGITAKIRWTNAGRKHVEPGSERERWIHCTPLIGINGAIGVWMIVVVDAEVPGADTTEAATGLASHSAYPASQRPKPRMAPPIDAVIGAKYRQKAVTSSLEGHDEGIPSTEGASEDDGLDSGLDMLRPRGSARDIRAVAAFG